MLLAIILLKKGSAVKCILQTLDRTEAFLVGFPRVFPILTGRRAAFPEALKGLVKSLKNLGSVGLEMTVMPSALRGTEEKAVIK